MRQPGRAARLAAAHTRDGATCLWCARSLDDRVPATTDHVIPKVRGGPSWLENEVAACRRCNGERGHRGAVDWLEECERRGWSPDADRLARVLGDLAEAISARGGQRRARPHLDAGWRTGAAQPRESGPGADIGARAVRAAGAQRSNVSGSGPTR